MPNSAKDLLHIHAPATRPVILNELTASPDKFTQDVVNAMEAYAKQESIGFVTWVLNQPPFVLENKSALQLFDAYKIISK